MNLTFHSQSTAQLVLIVALLAISLPATRGNRDEWVEPHAWPRSKKVAVASSGDACAPSDCPACPADAAPAEHGEFLYRKLINFMINEKRMKFDPNTERFHRTIHIHLSREQYDVVRNKGADLRDVDGVLQVIFSI